MGDVVAHPADRRRLGRRRRPLRAGVPDGHASAGHDIIRTWLFATITRSHHEFDCAPWKHAALSGWILDPDRKKMSKSKGNVVTPMDLFDTYGTDAVRYWAGSGRPGVDTAFSEDQMKVGRKLANKLLNVTKFVLQFGAPTADTSLDDGVTDPIDRSMLAKLDAVIDDATAAFEAFDYARALERTEAFFWWFCDNYVELVKGRTYDEQRPEGADSAKRALREALARSNGCSPRPCRSRPKSRGVGGTSRACTVPVAVAVRQPSDTLR